MQNDLIIVPMGEKHLAKLAQLEAMCFSTPWSEQNLREELDNPTAFFYVALMGEEIAGYIGTFVVCESCYISDIAVFPQYRRKKVGTALLHYAAQQAALLGAQSISLEVRPSNAAAIALYSCYGFEEVGLRKNFYRDPKEDALILTKGIEGKNGEDS